MEEQTGQPVNGRGFIRRRSGGRRLLAKVCADVSSPLPGQRHAFIRMQTSPNAQRSTLAQRFPRGEHKSKLQPNITDSPPTHNFFSFVLLRTVPFRVTFSYNQNQSWHKIAAVAVRDPGRSSMKEATQQQTWGKEMSATVLSAFYDMDMLYKVNVAAT